MTGEPLPPHDGQPQGGLKGLAHQALVLSVLALRCEVKARFLRGACRD